MPPQHRDVDQPSAMDDDIVYRSNPSMDPTKLNCLLFVNCYPLYDK